MALCANEGSPGCEKLVTHGATNGMRESLPLDDRHRDGSSQGGNADTDVISQTLLEH